MNLIRSLKSAKDEIDYSDTEDENDLSDIFNKIPSTILNIDEYEIFSNTLSNLHNHNPTIISSLKQNLNPNEKELWSEILHTRRIKVKDLDINVPRRIVKIKKN